MMDTHNQDHQRLCDFCSKSTALIYCRADSAKLCLNCDHEVHSTNLLFTKHTRYLLCDACDSSPVSIFCCTDNSVLCQNCDWEAHKKKPSSSLGVHDRRPIDGFTGCPSVSELLAILGLDDLGKKTILENNNISGDLDDRWMDFLTWDSPSVVSIEEFITLSDDADSVSGHNFQAIGVPPLPKNRNAVCGQHKEEILQQLREMSKTTHDLKDSDECKDTLIESQSLVPGQNSHLEDKDTYGCRGKLIEFQSPVLGENSKLEDKDTCLDNSIVPSYEDNAFEWCANDTNYLVLEKDFEVPDNSIQVCDGHEGSDHPVLVENLCSLPKVAVRELSIQERDFAISRYKEKKKTRRYDKHIRYESRKVRAESRTRVNGRFAKMDYKAAATQ